MTVLDAVVGSRNLYVRKDLKKKIKSRKFQTQIMERSIKLA